MSNLSTPSALLCSGFVGLLLKFSQAASSHSIMTSSIPEKESLISQAIPAVIVCFNENIGHEYRALSVTGESGNRFDNDPIEQFKKDNQLCLKKQLKPLTPGDYQVRYRVQSNDGHVVSGKYNFSFKAN